VRCRSRCQCGSGTLGAACHHLKYAGSRVDAQDVGWLWFSGWRFLAKSDRNPAPAPRPMAPANPRRAGSLPPPDPCSFPDGGGARAGPAGGRTRPELSGCACASHTTTARTGTPPRRSASSKTPRCRPTRRPPRLPPPPSRTDWTRLVPPPVLTGRVSSLLPYGALHAWPRRPPVAGGLRPAVWARRPSPLARDDIPRGCSAMARVMRGRVSVAAAACPISTG